MLANSPQQNLPSPALEVLTIQEHRTKNLGKQGEEGRAGGSGTSMYLASLGEVAVLGCDPKLTQRFLDDCVGKCECVWYSMFIGNFSPSDLVVLKVAKDMSCINCHRRRTCQQEEPQDTKSQHLLTRFGGN